MQNDNKNLFLYADPSVLHNPGKDEHPSRECHKVIARSVIEYIRNYE